MKSLYNLLIGLYHFSIKMAAPFNKKARLWTNGRKNIWQKIENEVTGGQKSIWFHAASLGEFEQGRPVIEASKKAFPDYNIVLTFFSPSGYEVRKNYKGADHIFYLPPDTRSNARKFIQFINPALAVFIKYEFWFNYLVELNLRKVKVFTISAIFRENQHFFKSYGKWAASQLKNIDYFFVQNRKSLELLDGIGIQNVSISGDTRFDRVATIASQQEQNEIAALFSKGRKVILAGSSWPEDEKLLSETIDFSNNQYRLIIAPHEIHEEHLTAIEKIFNKYRIIRYSSANKSNINNARVLLIDGIGFLSGLYKYCDVAVIGGGFGKGIHNILEAVTFGKPVVFGPNYKKFDEAVALLDLGGGFSFSDQKGLKTILEKLFTANDYYTNCSKVCKNFIKNNQGATAMILGKMEVTLKI